MVVGGVMTGPAHGLRAIRAGGAKSVACVLSWLIATGALAAQPAVSFAADLADGTAARGLSAAEVRGKALYQTGKSARGNEITATIAGEIELSATLYSCGQCHGADGRGRLEGGVLVPEIRWSRLTAPHGVPTYLGGLRPSYAKTDVERAVRDGVDSAGTPLDPLMPRYAIGEDDLADLMAYLRVLGTEAAPGVSEDTIRVATLLPGQSSTKVPDIASMETSWGSMKAQY